VDTLTTVDASVLQELQSREEFFWLDLDNPDRNEIAALGEILGLHELAVEDTQEFGQRPKADAYGEQLLLVYHGARLDSDGAPVLVEIHLHVSSRYVVTVHRDRCRQFDLIRELFKREPPSDGGTVVYKVIDALTDSIVDVLEHVNDQVEDFEGELFRRPRARDRDRMAVLKRSLGALRRVVVTQRHMLGRAVEDIIALPGMGREVSAYYRDVGDHLARAGDDLDATRDTLQAMLESYSNEVQERLTIVATIFLPLTVVTSFFGQNFAWLINRIGSAWAFWGLGIGGLLLSCCAIVVWLIRSGLYHGPKPYARSRRSRRTQA
jgi:magnesium transporter